MSDYFIFCYNSSALVYMLGSYVIMLLCAKRCNSA